MQDGLLVATIATLVVKNGGKLVVNLREGEVTAGKSLLATAEDGIATFYLGEPGDVPTEEMPSSDEVCIDVCED